MEGRGGQSEKHNLFTFSTPKVGPGAVATLDSTTKVIHFDESDRNSRPRLTGAQHNCAYERPCVNASEKTHTSPTGLCTGRAS